MTTQIVTKLKMGQTQIVTKLKNLNCDKTLKNMKLWQNTKTQIVTKHELGQISIYDKRYFKMVRTFLDIDNQWDVLWAAFRDSRDVFGKVFFLEKLWICPSLFSSYKPAAQADSKP